MAPLDIEVPRNGSYSEEWIFEALENGAWVPDPITGSTFSLGITAVAGDGAVIENAVCTIIDGAAGRLNITIDGTGTLAALDGEMQRVVLAWDLKRTYPDALVMIPVRGSILLTPGVTG